MGIKWSLRKLIVMMFSFSLIIVTFAIVACGLIQPERIQKIPEILALIVLFKDITLMVIGFYFGQSRPTPSNDKGGE